MFFSIKFEGFFLSYKVVEGKHSCLNQLLKDLFTIFPASFCITQIEWHAITNSQLGCISNYYSVIFGHFQRNNMYLPTLLVHIYGAVEFILV